MPFQGCAIIAGLLMLVGTPSFAQGYDLVIANGRVMDPETGFIDYHTHGQDDFAYGLY